MLLVGTFRSHRLARPLSRTTLRMYLPSGETLAYITLPSSVTLVTEKLLKGTVRWCDSNE